MTQAVRCWGVVPAAGVGKRMGADRPKQYLPLCGRTVLEHTLGRLLESGAFTGIAVAVSPEDPYWQELPIAADPRIVRADGGRERADSVLSALNALCGKAADADWILVHDAARPCIAAGDIRRLIDQLWDDPVGGILALPVHDTLKRVDDRRIAGTVERRRIWRALTPQMFRYRELKEALEEAARRGEVVTDEAGALELRGKKPAIVEGRPDNIKITRPEDLALAQFFLEQQC